MKCEKCGIEYEGEFCPQCSTQQEKPKKQKKPVIKKWWFWFLMGLATVVTVAAISGGGDIDPSTTNADATASKKPSSSQVEIVYEKADIKTMFQELDDNALKAETKYQNKYIEVIGEISNIDSDGNYISIQAVGAGSFNFDTITCYIKNDEQTNFIMEKSKGDVVTIKGKIKSVGEVLGYYLNIEEIK